MKFPSYIPYFSGKFNDRLVSVNDETGRSRVEKNPEIQARNNQSSESLLLIRSKSERKGWSLSFKRNSRNIEDDTGSEVKPEVNLADLPQHTSIFPSDDPVFGESILLGDGLLGNIDEFVDSFLKKSTVKNDLDADLVPLRKLASVTYADPLRSGEFATQIVISNSSGATESSVSKETSLSSNPEPLLPIANEEQQGPSVRTEAFGSIEFSTLSVQPPSSERSELLDIAVYEVGPDMSGKQNFFIQAMSTSLPVKSSSKRMIPSFSLEETAQEPKSPKAKHGIKSKFLQYQNPTLNQIRNDIKQSVINSHWDAFLRGELVGSNEKERLKDKLTMHMANQFAGRENNKKIRAYINKKLAQSPVTPSSNLCEQALFFSRGSNLKYDYLKTENNNLFRFSSREKILGKGKQAKVIMAKQILLQGQEKSVAAKVYDVSRSERKDAWEERRIISEDVDNECDIYQKLPDNDHFSRMRDKAIELNEKSYLFMDLAFGDLNKVMKKIRSEPDAGKREKLQRTLARQYIDAVREMHEADLYHQDIKPENLLVSKKGNVIVTDFATSAIENNTITHASRFYEAPETGKRNSTKSKGDMFSLGKTLCEMTNNGFKSWMIRENKQFRKFDRKLFNSKNSQRDVTALEGKTLKEVGLKLAAHNPSDRLDFAAIFALPYFMEQVTNQEEAGKGPKEVYKSEQLAKFLSGEKDWDH